MKDINKAIEKNLKAQRAVIETTLDIERLIIEHFKVTDFEGIANIKNLLAKNLMGDDSIMGEGVVFEPEDGLLKDFASTDEMAEKIWQTVKRSKKPLCSLQVWEKLSKKWKISKSQSNAILVTRTTWFRKLKKKINDEGNEVYFYRAKA